MFTLKSIYLRTRVFSNLWFCMMFLGISSHFFVAYDAMSLSINALNTPMADIFFRYITYLGNGNVIFILGVLLWYFNREMGLHCLLGHLLSSAVNSMLKNMVFGKLPRPIEHFWEHVPNLHLVDGVQVNHWYSFPSGHSTSIFMAMMVLSYGMPKPLYQMLFFGIALVAGFSRVYLFQHFLIDVLGGAMVGMVSACAVFAIVQHFSKMETPSNPSISLHGS